MIFLFVPEAPRNLVSEVLGQTRLDAKVTAVVPEQTVVPR